MMRGRAPIVMFFGLLLLPWPGQDPPVRHVPRTADTTFASRAGLCPAARSPGGVSQANDARRSVAQLVGTVTSVDVYQFGRNFVDFAAVQTYLVKQLAQKPRVMYRYSPWAEGTPLAEMGVLGVFHFAGGSTGVFEATDVHLCVQDASGVYWWFRVAPMDLWPTP